MKAVFICVAIFLATASAFRTTKVHPLSDEFINSINEKQLTWKAGRNFDANTPISHIKGLLGVLPPKKNAPKLPLKINAKRAIPDSFDSREEWKDCASIIGNIRDQAACGSCWAFGAVEAMSDRICIASQGATKLSISAEDLLTCCSNCGDGCNGGWPSEAWSYWEYAGIVTGGGYNSQEGCKSYAFESCEHHVNGSKPPCGETQPTPACRDNCDSGSSLVYSEDLKHGSAYRVDSSQSEIQNEILTNGPVEASFEVFEDFVSYKSGVYQHTQGGFLGGHAVKILGWGEENGTPYWLVANSWNPDWGDKGYFKILRGNNECGIEEDIVAGLPQL